MPPRGGVLVPAPFGQDETQRFARAVPLGWREQRSRQGGVPEELNVGGENGGGEMFGVNPNIPFKRTLRIDFPGNIF